MDYLTRDVTEERRNLAQTSPDQLWNEFNELCASFDEAEELPNADISHANRVVEALKTALNFATFADFELHRCRIVG